ncbi:MAG: 4Fe-4S binding protein, partial [Candidatus Methanomethylophilaceae archaeon]|nr:4Fe-4S binding protein [Candidatus Methanomethylophilaceae archaeon]
DQKICRACGRCSEMCPHDAITISYDEKGVLSEMERMGTILEISDRKA